MENGYVLSVTQLNDYVASLFQRDALLRGLSVRGEVSGFKRHSSGHIYFTLKDAGALVRCVMFRQDAIKCSIPISDGMELIADGHAALYARDGQYQFYVKAVRQAGEGELYRRFLMLKTRLQARGFFDEAHKKPLPELPRCIGIVTSQSGAAVRDIISITRRRFPGMNLLLCPVAVQGAGAAEEIAEGIRCMNRLKRADVLIVGRGGGSLEDLWAFNEECVAEAIYDSQIPVVSAVGHETDFSIADFVADLRAPTPSAAAELCVPEYDSLLSTLESMREALADAAHSCLMRQKMRINAIAQSSAFALPVHQLSNARHATQDAQRRLDAAAHGALSAASRSYGVLSSKLEALSPAHTLARGFALVQRGNGEYCGKAEMLSPHDVVRSLFQDGDVHATVKAVSQTGKRD